MDTCVKCKHADAEFFDAEGAGFCASCWFDRDIEDDIVDDDDNN